MIVYRDLRCEELMDMINNKYHNKIKNTGKSTFDYQKGVTYKHFFVFGDHAEFYKKYINAPVIGVYDIPDDIICQRGFGFYSPIKTPINRSLYSGYDMVPLPEIIIEDNDYNKDLLLTIKPGFNEEQARYNYGANNPFERTFEAGGYNYSYADVYYEIVCKLAARYNMDMKKVASTLKNLDLKKEIEEYFNENYDYFEKSSVKIKR